LIIQLKIKGPLVNPLNSLVFRRAYTIPNKLAWKPFGLGLQQFSAALILSLRSKVTNVKNRLAKRCCRFFRGCKGL